LDLRLRMLVSLPPEKPFAYGSPNAVQVPDIIGSKCCNNDLIQVIITHTSMTIKMLPK
jgi:hypothetical protein